MNITKMICFLVPGYKLTEDEEVNKSRGITDHQATYPNAG